MTFKSKIIRLFTFSMIALSVVACNKDNTSSPGQVNFEVTDAPFDDAEIQAVFVTVAAIKVDGKVIDNFNGKPLLTLLRTNVVRLNRWVIPTCNRGRTAMLCLFWTIIPTKVAVHQVVMF